LFGISIVLAVLGLIGDAVLTVSIVAGNVVVGIFQECRAKRQLDRIALLTRPRASVLRNGAEVELDPNEIVQGDLLIVRPGDQVQADGKLINEEGLSIDEALLTGESDLVAKDAGDEVYAGTYVMQGTGVYEAVGVGTTSVAHQITARARAYKVVKTPLQREVGMVIWVMAGIVVVLAIATVISFQNLYGELPLEETTRASAVIVAIIPQGLWFMVTITYAMAIVRLARSGALIQTMNSVESLSHVDVLCLDKTGTLTTNRLHLELIQPIGSASKDDVTPKLGAFAASASFSNRTNEALLDNIPSQAGRPLEEVTFDSARKWSAIVSETAPLDGLYVLGAPEVLGPKLVPGEPLGDDVAAWAEEGLRVLLFAHQPGVKQVGFDELKPELPTGLVPLSFVVLSDELRADARETVERFAEGGIKLKILSGDNPDTVQALAEQAGFRPDTPMMSGIDLDKAPKEDLPRIVDEVTIFGRITPRNKEDLVTALQANGHYVAMTGDGVNDVPALKTAQVAVAMRSGSPVTRSVADIVLLNDSFSALPHAFIEGQRIRLGMQEIVRLFLVRSLSVALVILGAALLGEAFPVTPRHTALISMLAVGGPAMVLAAIARPGPSKHFLVRSAVDFILPAAFSIALVSLAVYEVYTSTDEPLNHARTALTITATMCGILIIPYAAYSTDDWLKPEVLLRRPAVTTLMVVLFAAMAIAFAVPILRDFYELSVLSVGGYAACIGMVAVWALLLKAFWALELHVPLRKLGMTGIDETAVAEGLAREGRPSN
jgi:cation-transporting ATPase E